MNKTKLAGLIGSAITIGGLAYSLYREVAKINFDDIDFNYGEEPYVTELDEEDSKN